MSTLVLGGNMLAALYAPTSYIRFILLDECRVRLAGTGIGENDPATQGRVTFEINRTDALLVHQE
jgi:hypothetical protein